MILCYRACCTLKQLKMNKIRETSPYAKFTDYYYNLPVDIALGNILLAIDKGKLEKLPSMLESIKEIDDEKVSPKLAITKLCSDDNAASVQDEIEALEPKWEHFLSVKKEECKKLELILQTEQVDRDTTKAHLETISRAWHVFGDAIKTLKAKALV